MASAHHLIKPHYCRYRRSGKYHDKSVNALHVSDNGYIITASLGSKYDDDDYDDDDDGGDDDDDFFVNIAMVMLLMMMLTKKHPRFVKIWKVNTESGIVSKTDVTELQILREHKDYLSVSIFESSSS